MWKIKGCEKMNETTVTENTFSQGVRDCVPTLLGYISIGVSFGVVGIASNLSVLEVFLLAFFVYAGSAQFIFCGLYVAGAPVSSIIVTVFIVNLRHFLMSLTIAPYFTRYSSLRNIGFGTLLTDETFGVAITKLSKEQQLGGRWMDGLNVTAYVVWVFSCTFGAVVGAILPNLEQLGLDFALVAMFAALLILNVQAAPKERLLHYVTLCSMIGVIFYICLYILPSHIAILVSTLLGATIGVLRER